MSKHNFIESREHGGKYDVIIYCTWCGKVVWDFNRNEVSVAKLQSTVKEPCIVGKS